MNSPLGEYAPKVAAVCAVLIIGLWGAIQLLIVLGPVIGLEDGRLAEPPGLSPVAFIVIGAVFGSAVVANGHKEPLRQAQAANARLDAIGAPSAAQVEPPPAIQ